MQRDYYWHAVTVENVVTLYISRVPKIILRDLNKKFIQKAGFFKLSTQT